MYQAYVAAKSIYAIARETIIGFLTLQKSPIKFHSIVGMQAEVTEIITDLCLFFVQSTNKILTETNRYLKNLSNLY